MVTSFVWITYEWFIGDANALFPPVEVYEESVGLWVLVRVSFFFTLMVARYYLPLRMWLHTIMVGFECSDLFLFASYLGFQAVRGDSAMASGIRL